MRRGLTLWDVALYLGHSRIETTQTFAEWADDSLKRVLEGWYISVNGRTGAEHDNARCAAHRYRFTLRPGEGYPTSASTCQSSGLAHATAF